MNWLAAWIMHARWIGTQEIRCHNGQQLRRRTQIWRLDDEGSYFFADQHGEVLGAVRMEDGCGMVN